MFSYTDIRELLKDARNLAEGANDLQLKGKLLDIQGAVYDLQEENRKLRIENEALKNNADLENRLLKEGRFWKDPQKDYLYCPVCWGKNHKLISTDLLKGTMLGDVRECPVCHFYD